MKKYYADEIQHQFVISQPNVAWFIDCSELSFKHKHENIKLELFLIIDGCYNEVVAYRVKQTLFLHADKRIPTAFTSQELIETIDLTLKRRNIKKHSKNKLIIHSDRGTQFSSRRYENFTRKSASYFVPSMSPCCSPTNNAVVERFNRTIKSYKVSFQNKEHTIVSYLNETKSIEKLSDEILTEIIKIFVVDYNDHKKTKKAPLGAAVNNRIHENVKEFLYEPEVTKAYSKHCFQLDSDRRNQIETYKKETMQLWERFEETFLEEETFQNTKPLLLKKLFLIDQKVDEQIILGKTTKIDTEKIIHGQKLTMEALGQVAELIYNLNEKVESLVKKPRKKANKIKLRDPVSRDLYNIFMENAGSKNTRLQKIKRLQLQIVYTVLYYVGLRVNELKSLTKADIIKAMDTSEFSIIHSKTGTTMIHVLPKSGQIKLRAMKSDIEEFFYISGYKCLGGSKLNSEEAYNDSHFIRLVNKDMLDTCEKKHIPYNLSSHSFRAGYITRLLKSHSVQFVSKLIGHSSISSTMSYFRYVVNKEAIIEAIKDAF